MGLLFYSIAFLLTLLTIAMHMHERQEHQIQWDGLTIPSIVKAKRTIMLTCYVFSNAIWWTIAYFYNAL